jgi:hypothetical protein
LLKTADEFSRAVSVRPPNTNLRLAQKTVADLYKEAAEAFDSVISKAKDPEEQPNSVNKKRAEDELTAWLEGTHIHDRDHGHNHEHDEPIMHSMPWAVNFDTPVLYRCSFCGNPSAVLKKCMFHWSHCALLLIEVTDDLALLQVVDAAKQGEITSLPLCLHWLVHLNLSLTDIFPRYCDASCQKSHWKEHKKVCVAA